MENDSAGEKNGDQYENPPSSVADGQRAEKRYREKNTQRVSVQAQCPKERDRGGALEFEGKPYEQRDDGDIRVHC